jgi:hypothetical protein
MTNSTPTTTETHEPTAPPLDAPAVAQRTVAALDQLERAARALRGRLYDPDAHDRDAVAVLARRGERVGHLLPVATLRWPTKGADPFTTPTLVETD